MRTTWSVFALLLLPLPVAAQDQAPSFSCAAAGTSVEQAICGDPDLAALDAKLDRAFRVASAADPVGRAMLLDGQRAWLKSRIGECRPAGSGKPVEASCLKGLYEARLTALQGHDARDTPICQAIATRIRDKGGFASAKGSLPDAIAGDSGAPIRLGGSGEPMTSALLAKLPKSDDLQTENSTIEHFGSNHAFLAVDFVQGSMHCQYIALFKIVSGGSIQPLDLPSGANVECPQGTMFGSTAGAAPTIPLYVETADTMPTSSMTLWSRRDDAWHSACTIEARYATSLALERRSCAKGADCAALETVALALAEKRDAIAGEAPNRLGTAERLLKTRETKGTLSLPSFDDGEADAFSDFETDAPFYALSGPQGPLVLRISHGTVGWRTDENWLVGVYARDHEMAPLAGFVITKSRAALRDVSIR